MTKKQFEHFARLIKAQQGVTADTDLRTFADIVIAVVSAYNQSFDREKFLRACGF